MRKSGNDNRSALARRPVAYGKPSSCDRLSRRIVENCGLALFAAIAERPTAVFGDGRGNPGWEVADVTG